jgi:hypothetical protein
VPAVSGGWASRAAGYKHTCGILKSDDSARCWGQNFQGQSTVPAVSGGWASLAAGTYHTCGILKSDDSARCWGYNQYGQTTVPASCWGQNSHGQTTVPAVSGGWASLAVGDAHTCGAVCETTTESRFGTPRPPAQACAAPPPSSRWQAHWHDPPAAQRRRPSADPPTPRRPRNPDNSPKVCFAPCHCGVVKADDTARCWGQNSEGQTTVPAVSGGWASLAAGDAHTCGVVKADDTARCWGANWNGQTTVPKP